MDDLKLLTVEDLARLLHIKPATVLDRLYRRPDAVPPRINVPGKPLWLPTVVEDWLKERSEA